MKGVISIQSDSFRVYFSALKLHELFVHQGEYFRKISHTHALSLNQMKPVLFKEQSVIYLNRETHINLPTFTRGEQTTFDMISVGDTFTMVNCVEIMKNTVVMKISDSEIMYMETLTMAGWKCSADDEVQSVSADEVNISIR